MSSFSLDNMSAEELLRLAERVTAAATRRAEEERAAEERRRAQEAKAKHESKEKKRAEVETAAKRARDRSYLWPIVPVHTFKPGWPRVEVDSTVESQKGKRKEPGADPYRHPDTACGRCARLKYTCAIEGTKRSCLQCGRSKVKCDLAETTKRAKPVKRPKVAEVEDDDDTADDMPKPVKRPRFAEVEEDSESDADGDVRAQLQERTVMAREIVDGISGAIRAASEVSHKDAAELRAEMITLGRSMDRIGDLMEQLVGPLESSVVAKEESSCRNLK